ncbi:hypothetical protein H4219_005643 [Mycoemilia scoparia]|uniref:CST complex subunit STN1 n=1 Tax=Mycoemilia scoparia TaxID=417184 RepID=A0A9W8DP40_9FUNG|nr:hypothetical protein H4219_005643 [Mycoemilia scoparia]
MAEYDSTRDTEKLDWGLDPMFWTAAKLFVADILKSRPAHLPEVYFVGEYKVVRQVEIVGVVVGVTNSAKFNSFLVDDGTGVIPCIQWHPRNFGDSSEKTAGAALPGYYGGNPESNAPAISLGSLVCVVGKMSEFRNQLQIKAKSVVNVDNDPNFETLAWLERMAIRKSI